jgi:UDP-N-acetylmuramoyl-L-alanyl-D-glutamate--2,6-diaminopimelate ligase
MTALWTAPDTLQPGDLLVALRGESGDGLAFVAEALNGLGAADVLAVARKGQTIGDAVISFDDVSVVRRLVGAP